MKFSQQLSPSFFASFFCFYLCFFPSVTYATWCSNTDDSQYCVLCDDNYISHSCVNYVGQCPEGISGNCFADGDGVSCECYGPETPIEDPGCTGYIRLVAGNLENVDKLDADSDDGTLKQIDPSREIGAFQYFELDENQTAYDPGYSIEEDIAIPVGTSFYLQYEGNRYLTETPANGCPEYYDILFSNVEVGAETITPSLNSVDQQVALFKDNVIVPFSSSSSDRIRQFYAAHYGEATIKVEPDSRYGNYFPPITVHVIVIPPKDILMLNGNSIPRYQNENIVSDIADIVHRRGIPLKMLIGQIAQESRFNPLMYRYEPKQDYAVVQQNTTSPIYGPILKQQSLPYSAENIAANIAKAYPGEDMSYPDDVALRNYSLYPLKVKDSTTNILRVIENADTPTIADLINYNQNQNWSAKENNLTSTVAQTTTAASYGYIQIMFLTAFDMARAYGFQKQVKPTHLVDTKDNLINGWGSLNLGTLWFLTSSSLKKLLTNLPNSYMGVLDVYKAGLVKYNKGDPKYPGNVFKKATEYIIQPESDPLGVGYFGDTYTIFYRQNGYY